MKHIVIILKIKSRKENMRITQLAKLIKIKCIPRDTNRAHVIYTTDKKLNEEEK